MENSNSQPILPEKPPPSQILGEDYISHLPNEILLVIVGHLIPTDLRQLSRTCVSFYSWLHVPRPPKQCYLEFPCFCHVAAPGDWSYTLHRAIRGNPAWGKDMKQYIWLCPHRTKLMRDVIRLKSTPFHFSDKQHSVFDVQKCDHQHCRNWISYTISRRIHQPFPAPKTWELKSQLTVMKIHLPQGVEVPRMLDPMYLATNLSVLNHLLHNLQALAHVAICPHLSISHRQVWEAVLPGKILEDPYDEHSVQGPEHTIRCELCQAEMGTETFCWWSAEVKQATRWDWAQLHVNLNVVRGLGKMREARPWQREFWIAPRSVKPSWWNEAKAGVGLNGGIQVCHLPTKE